MKQDSRIIVNMKIIYSYKIIKVTNYQVLKYALYACNVYKNSGLNLTTNISF